jgi:hypothetical protein
VSYLYVNWEEMAYEEPEEYAWWQSLWETEPCEEVQWWD